jgi:hypothetical protein
MLLNSILLLPEMSIAIASILIAFRLYLSRA